MAALTLSGSSLPCLFLARVLILLAFHSTSEAFNKDVEYTLLAKPSSYVSVIRYNSLGALYRVRRSDDTDNAVQNNKFSTSKSPVVTQSTISSTPLTTTIAPTTTRVQKTSPPVSVSTQASTTLPPTTTTIATSTTPAPTTAAPSTSAAPSTTPTTTNKIVISTSPITTVTTPLAKVIEDSHVYYKSKIIQDAVDDNWLDLGKAAHRHQVLSNNHRMAASVRMSFTFRFFGHNVQNVTVATGGFLYMGPFLHQWLTATQYIAPMMANFDTSIANYSDVKIKDDGNQFVVQWYNVHLKDQTTSTPFSFQASLYKNGTIKFVYKELPILPYRISTKKHPVKIGLSDAYYIDTTSKEGIIRTIYEYHRVSIDLKKIQPGAVVVLEPLPTCNLAQDCNTCVNQKINFNCSWCPTVKRCSDGIDWHRQNWYLNKCHQLTQAQMKRCESSETDPTITITAPSPKQVEMDHTIILTAPPPAPTQSQLKQGDSKKSPIAAVIGVVLILIVCISLGGWCYYGYTHPSTPLGIWMMEHRPSQMKAKMANMKFWKQSTPAGDKYRIESEA